MIRRWFSTGGRWGVVVSVALVELVLAWLSSLAATSPLLVPLLQHPQGAFALHAQGGRLLGEIVLARENELIGIVALLGVVMLLWVATWMLLGGMFPVLGASAGVRWHRAAAESLRRAPTLLGLAAIAGLGLGLAGLAWYFAGAWAAREAAHRFDVRVISLLGLVGWGVAGLMTAGISLWHDVARVHAMARGLTAMQASGASMQQVIRQPIATVLAGAGFGLIGWSYVGLAALVAGLLEWRPSVGAAVTLLVVRHVAVIGRVHARMKWFVWLGARLPARKEAESR